MNAIWKDILLVMMELILMILVIYELTRQAENGLAFFLLLLLLVIVGVHLFLKSKHMFYNFGLWFYCYC